MLLEHDNLSIKKILMTFCISSQIRILANTMGVWCQNISKEWCELKALFKFKACGPCVVTNLQLDTYTYLSGLWQGFLVKILILKRIDVLGEWNCTICSKYI